MTNGNANPLTNTQQTGGGASFLSVLATSVGLPVQAVAQQNSRGDQQSDTAPETSQEQTPQDARVVPNASLVPATSDSPIVTTNLTILPISGFRAVLSTTSFAGKTAAAPTGKDPKAAKGETEALAAKAALAESPVTVPVQVAVPASVALPVAKSSVDVRPDAAPVQATSQIAEPIPAQVASVQNAGPAVVPMPATRENSTPALPETSLPIRANASADAVPKGTVQSAPTPVLYAAQPVEPKAAPLAATTGTAARIIAAPNAGPLPIAEPTRQANDHVTLPTAKPVHDASASSSLALPTTPVAKATPETQQTISSSATPVLPSAEPTSPVANKVPVQATETAASNATQGDGTLRQSAPATTVAANHASRNAATNDFYLAYAAGMSPLPNAAGLPADQPKGAAGDKGQPVGDSANSVQSSGSVAAQNVASKPVSTATTMPAPHPVNSVPASAGQGTAAAPSDSGNTHDEGAVKGSAAAASSTPSKSNAAQSATPVVGNSPQGSPASQHNQTDGQPAAPAMKAVDAAPVQAAVVHVAVQTAVTTGSAGTSNPQHPAEATHATLPGASDGIDAESGAAGINTARLIQTLSETQMHVGMHSTEFGDISIRTAVSQQQMVAQITVDHGDLGRAIALHAPSAQTKLGDDLGLHAAIEVTQNGASFSQHGGSASHQEQRSFVRSTAPVGAVHPAEADRLTPRSIVSAADTDRLDIQA